MMKKIRISMLLLVLVIVLASGCAGPVSECVGPEDNPEHHYLRGMELLGRARLDDASAKFERAVSCDDSYSPAHAGLAVVNALRAAQARSGEYRKVDVEKARAELKKAWKKADTNEDEFAYYLASMRVETALKSAKWLRNVKRDYKKSMKLKVDEKRLIYYDVREAATYFMGRAYLDAREFDRARESFAAVLNSVRDSRWNAPADEYWKKTDKIVRALAGITLGDVGREIAVRESVSRGDMAALLIDELKIDKLFAGRIPVKSVVDGLKAEFTPADVLSSPFKEEVLTLMKWRVRGLEPVYDAETRAYLFKPDAPVSRKVMALVLEDVIIKLTGDEKMASAFFGHEHSPYPDVPPTSAWYNAIMNVVTRNIMETGLSGEFRPDEAVDGAEAVLAVRVLRQRLNIH